MARPLWQFVYLDVEVLKTGIERHGLTQVHHRGRGLALAVTWQEEDGYRSYTEQNIPELIAYLEQAECVVGFNLEFDRSVIEGYAPVKFRNTCDLMKLCVAALDEAPSLVLLIEGLNLPETWIEGDSKTILWRDGFREVVEHYTQNDVSAMRRIHLHLASNTTLELTFTWAPPLSGKIDHVRFANVLPPVLESDITSLDE